MSTPLIAIFVRHAEGCKHAGDEFSRRCQCRKHLRWTANGKQYRKQAGTRSWAEAETAKRNLEDQLAGKTPAASTDGKAIDEAVAVFLQDKRVQGVTADVLAKYKRELARLQAHCERAGVFTVQGIDRERLTAFCDTWDTLYPSSTTRAKVRERVRGFLRYCFEAQWIPRIPQLPKMKIDEVPTMPLSADEYARLLDAVALVAMNDPVVTQRDRNRARTRGLFQLMRFSGLAIQDALTLRRDEVRRDGDEAKSLYRVVTSRQKTGVHVSVPIPAAVAAELLAIPNSSPDYLFWDGKVSIETLTRKWSRYRVAPAFKAAGLYGDCFATSHRLRDTFAVDLLEKGVPLEEVSKLLGHESIKTTEKSYAKWVKGRQDRLDALVTGTWGAA
jgi:integrase/recombinase XerD